MLADTQRSTLVWGECGWRAIGLRLGRSGGHTRAVWGETGAKESAWSDGPVQLVEHIADRRHTHHRVETKRPAISERAGESPIEDFSQAVLWLFFMLASSRNVFLVLFMKGVAIEDFS